ncbi:uncharacterized protein IL334_003922 [Kwoniella shivajii]|uniref:Uncharacterized protein n=1 Tax=Kwoniella shivajii TaxID=564305 RepID=A0ABZ1D2Z8_9TREE|nr:hypothetical protein IL334_003922 [Kwoniella shivajii]
MSSPFSHAKNQSNHSRPTPNKRTRSSPDIIGIDEEHHHRPSTPSTNHTNDSSKLGHTYSTPQMTPKRYNGVNAQYKSPASVNMGPGKKLTRRANQDSNSSATIVAISPQVEEENTPRKKKNASNININEKELQNRNEDGNDIDDEFDAMAPIHVFDSKTELEASWDKLQGELVEFLKDYTHDTLAHASENILHVTYLFENLNDQVQKDLAEGVKAIANEELRHEEARGIITAFSNEMKRAAEVLTKFSSAGNAVRALIEAKKDKVEA